VGIYPDTQYTKVPNQPDLLVRTYNDYSGLIITEYYQRILIVEDRKDCYCCSCGDTPDDPFCRNHGFAGTRPCDKHQMPGTPDEDGNMPESVQRHNLRRKLTMP